MSNRYPMSLGSDETENNLDNICWNWYILYNDWSLLINNEVLIVVMRVSQIFRFNLPHSKPICNFWQHSGQSKGGRRPKRYGHGVL